MTANTGRTTMKWVNFLLEDAGGALRNIPISSLTAVGVTFDEVDLTAFQDAVRGRLPAMPDAPIEISGPLDTTAAAVAPALSGSHTILAPLNGAMSPLTLDIQIGVRHAWEAGEPQFGITAAAASGYIVTNYIVNPQEGTYSARLVLFPGSALPAWGTAAETV
jgi:hypothetical protein